MATTLTTQEKEQILELQAKLKKVENLLANIQVKKQADVDVANNTYKTTMANISSNYATQISDLQAEIDDINAQLEAVK